MPISSWSTTPSDNNANPPAGWPEGMAASAVNNVGRQMMADIAAGYQGTEPMLNSLVRTAAEITAGVTPSNYAYPEGNVLRYGAVADWAGTPGSGTNNSTAIQNAINVAEAGGSSVFIPAGQYRLTSGLTIDSSDVTILGEGKRVSRLHFDVAAATCLTVSATVRAVLRHFGLETNATNQANVGLLMSNGRFSTIQDIRTLLMATVGFDNQESTGQNGSWTNTYERCVADACDIGFRLGNESNAVTYSDCEVLDSVGSSVSYAVQLENGCKGVFFSRCRFENYRTAGIFIDASAATVQVRNIVFSECYTEIPNNNTPDSLFVQFTDSASGAVICEKMVFANCYISDLEATSRASIADLSLGTHASSAATVDVINCQYINFAAVVATQLFDISADTTLMVLNLTREPGNVPIYTAGEAGMDIWNRRSSGALEFAGDVYVNTGALRADHLGIVETTTTAMASISDPINTDGLVSGYQKIAKNTTTGVVSVKAGSTAGSVWVNISTGATTHTPVP